jgi:putative transposase
VKQVFLRAHRTEVGVRARQDVFDDIEMFYNPKRKRTNKGMPSHVDFETGQQKLNGAGV